MEVHPPEHGIHSLHDFLVHMGTITLGLLIAIGLEQSVEWSHHRHQLHELHEGLQEDTEKAIRDSQHIETRVQVSVEWLDQQEAEVRATITRKKSIIDLPPHQHVEIDLPGAPSWRAAKAGGLLQIVSQQDIQAYSEVDDLIVQDDAAYVRSSDTVSKRLAFEKQFATDEESNRHDFGRATEAQLQEYIRLLEEEKNAYLWWGSWAHQIRGAETAISHGERNLDKIQAAER